MSVQMRRVAATPGFHRARLSRARLVRLSPLPALILVANTLAGCGGSDAPPNATRPAMETTQPDWPILVVRETGGLRPAGASLDPPRFYLTADGRLVVRGPRTAIYPPAALANLQERKLQPPAVARLRELVRAAGLGVRPVDYGRPAVADAATTEVTYRDRAGRTFVHRAYALGVDEGLDPSAMRARERLAGLLTELDDPVTLLGAPHVGESEPYMARALEILARPAPPAEELDVDPETREWPLTAVRLAQADTCTPVSGPDAAALLRSLRSASEITRWTQDGLAYVIRAAPVLPGDAPCL